MLQYSYFINLPVRSRDVLHKCFKKSINTHLLLLAGYDNLQLLDPDSKKNCNTLFVKWSSDFPYQSPHILSIILYLRSKLFTIKLDLYTSAKRFVPT